MTFSGIAVHTARKQHLKQPISVTALDEKTTQNIYDGLRQNH